MTDVPTNVYFVTIGKREEIQVIKKIRPQRLLCSYWYFRNRPLKELCSSIGYVPEIMLDSGAYSAFTKGKSVNVLEYMAYIKANEPFISRYVALDVIGDHLTTELFYDLMKIKGLEPIPVFHYGDDSSLMDHYISTGAKLVALGGTVVIRDKDIVATWCAEIHRRYPETKLHLLGSSSQKIMESGAVASCDSSAWYMMAVNGKPEMVSGENRSSVLDRAEANMKRIMEVFNEDSVPCDNSNSKHSHC